MADKDDIKALETRVTNLESAVGNLTSRSALYNLPINVDPPAWPWPVFGGGWGVYRPGGGIPDPAPVDYSRLPVAQLESTLHSINGEKARLASLETQVTQHLERARKKG